MRDVAEGHPIPSFDDLKEKFWLNWAHLTDHKPIKWYGQAPLSYGVRGEAMLGSVYDILPEITPLSPAAIEASFQTPLDTATWTLNGVMDLVTANGVLVDWKTTGTPWTQEDADKSLQVAAYYLGYRELFGEWPAGLTFVVMVHPRRRGLGGAADLQLFHTRRTVDQVLWYRTLAGTVAAAIEAGIHVPNPTYRWCGERSCHWYHPCQTPADGGPSLSPQVGTIAINAPVTVG